MKFELSEWKLEYAESVSKAINNKKVIDNLRDGIPFPYSKKDGESYIKETLNAEKGSQYCWAIMIDNSAAGSIGIFRQANIHRLTGEMGYYLAEEFWGKGIMSSAIKEACRLVFDNTDIVRIFAEPFSYNIASCRALEKAGFQFEGVLRKNAIKNGKIIDMKMYSIIKP